MKRKSTLKRGLMIGGDWTSSEKTFSVTNKYSGVELESLTSANTKDIDKAIDSAFCAKQVMAKLPSHKRSSILADTASLISKHSDKLSKTLAAESGKPLKYAIGEVERAVNTFSIAAEECKRIHGETFPADAVPSGENFQGYWQRKPVGVVAAITPFNFPLNLVAHKIAPAIAAGNPFILKPASTTPLSSVELMEILVEAGLPPQAANMVCGRGSITGPAIVGNDKVSKVSFTGSPDTGKDIVARAGLKKVTMELGNNSPLIVEDIGKNFELNHVVSRAVTGAFAYQGQVCISIQRIYVNRRLYDSFLNAFIKQTQDLTCSDPLLETTDLGPMISPLEAGRVRKWVEEARIAGAQIHCAGKLKDSESFVEPTIITNATESMKVMKEEVFGPVVSIVPYDDYEDALTRAEDSAFGLQAGIFTNDMEKAFTAIDRLNYGGVIINDIPTFRLDHQPYGGNRNSGLGREGLRFAIEDMTTLQMVLFNRPPSVANDKTICR